MLGVIEDEIAQLTKDLRDLAKIVKTLHLSGEAATLYERLDARVKRIEKLENTEVYFSSATGDLKVK